MISRESSSSTIGLMALFIPLDFRSASNRTLKTDVRPFLSQRHNEFDVDSSTNQMVFHGLPSNVHSFPVSH